MKNKMMYLAVAAIVMMASCSGKKTVQNETSNDSTSIADTAAAGENVDLAAVAGTYEGTLPAADCPGIKTVLKDGHDEASGVLQVLDGSVLMLVRPSSGEHTFYKVKDAKSVVMTDSLGNEPEGEMAKLYVLTKK